MAKPKKEPLFIATVRGDSAFQQAVKHYARQVKGVDIGDFIREAIEAKAGKEIAELTKVFEGIQNAS